MPETHARILNAALELVATRGFHGTSMSRIAKRVGISTATIYHHFDSQHHLYHELYQQVKTRAVRAAVAGVDDSAPLRDRVRQVNDQYITHLLLGPREASFITRYELSTYYRQAPHIDGRDALAELINAATRDGIYHQPMALLRVFSTGIAGLIAEMHEVGQLEINEQIIQQALEMSWSALRK